MTKVVSRKSSIDGLFIWLAAVSQGCHLNILHAGRVWTTQESEMVVMMDATIVYIVHCFLSTQAMRLTDPAKDLSTDSEYVRPFANPLETEHSFIMIPPVLNDPVRDMEEQLEETSLLPVSDINDHLHPGALVCTGGWSRRPGGICRCGTKGGCAAGLFQAR